MRLLLIQPTGLYSVRLNRFMVVATSVAAAVSPVLHLPMEMSGNKDVLETTTGHRYDVRGKHACNVPAVLDQGLRFDGYSTYIQLPLSDFALSALMMVSVSLPTVIRS